MVEALGLLDLDLDELELGISGTVVIPQDLGRAANRAQGVPDLVGQHRRHLPQG